MTRMTKYSREAIADRAISHAFDPIKGRLDEEENALATEAYNFVIPKDEREAVKKLPENWFRPDKCLEFNVGGQNIRLKTKGEGFPIPYRPKGFSRGGYHCHRLGVIPHGDLCDRIQKHVQAVEAYKSDRNKASNEVLSMLSTVNTIKQLKEAWPEGERFYSMYLEAAAPSLPAVRVDEINSMLGLTA